MSERMRDLIDGFGQRDCRCPTCNNTMKYTDTTDVNFEYDMVVSRDWVWCERCDTEVLIVQNYDASNYYIDLIQYPDDEGGE